MILKKNNKLIVIQIEHKINTILFYFPDKPKDKLTQKTFDKYLDLRTYINEYVDKKRNQGYELLSPYKEYLELRKLGGANEIKL